MSLVVITGGRGGLGSELAPRLAAAGHAVRILSRRARPAGAEHEWAPAEIETGEGLAEGLAGADVVVHAASSPFRRTRAVDVDGTGRLLKEAASAGVSHFFYISIVGIDRIPLPYYKAKLAAEKLIEESGVPYSILRATQFHSLIDRFLATLVRLPIALLPKDLRFQPIDTGEVAERMAEYVGGGAAGRLPDLGGPRVHTLGDLAQQWLRARGRRAALLHLPLPGRVAAGFRRGYNCAPEQAAGKVRWADWLASKYGSRT